MSLDPLDVPAAMAALRAAWAEMREIALKLEGYVERGEATEGSSGLKALLDELWEGHEKALFEVSIFDRDDMRAAQVEELLTRYPNGESDFYQNELMQAEATLADVQRMQAVEQLGALEALEGATPEQMEAWSAEERAAYFESLNLLREERETHLGCLPIAERREWERRLGG